MPTKLLTKDHFVPHISTVKANKGERVKLFVRQKVQSGKPRTARPVVLFVHGRTSPAVPAFDLAYKDYSWMAFLARAGFDCYAMDLTGYGGSPKPMMDDASNVDPAQQDLLVGRPLKRKATAAYPWQLNTIRDDWAEIDSVVEYLRRRTRAKRIHLIGWSAGGPRVGGYAAQHPDKIDRVVLFAPSPPIEGPIPNRPARGFPVELQTRDELLNRRWARDVHSKRQIERGMAARVWRALMTWDSLGASWGPKGGVMRIRTATRFGWTRSLIQKLRAPTLVIAGDYDRLEERRGVYELLGARDKVFVGVAGASHFMQWERQHRVLHELTRAWLVGRGIEGEKRGEFRVDAKGKIMAL